MFGIRFIKVQPTIHLMQFQRGRVVREGTGLALDAGGVIGATAGAMVV